MLVIQAYRFELDPSNHARSALASHAGAARFAFNWGLGLVKDRLDARRTLEVLALRQGASSGEARDWAAEVAGALPWNLPALRREWNRAKADVAPWWAENSKEAYSSGLDALARGLRAFSSSRSGTRAGPRVGFPRFKRKGSRRSFRITTGSFGVCDARHLRLPRIGVLRTKEPTDALLARLQVSTARVLSAAVSEVAGRWFVSFACVVDRAEVHPARLDAVVGVDVGVTHLAVCSDGTVAANPRSLNHYVRRMARLQRQMARQAPASRRRRRTRAELARTHARAANVRRNAMHVLTHRLATTAGTVVVEHLNVVGMTARGHGRGRAAKAGLNRAILDASLAELRRQLTYKCAWYGSTLVVAPVFYPSSKKCSACGTAKAKLSLSERIFECESCGVSLCRDANAAANLAALAADVAGSGPETRNGRGGGRRQAGGNSGRCPPVKRQAGTGHSPDRTGTVATQEATA